MSEPPSTTANLNTEAARLRHELEGKAALIQNIRRDLIHAQITILELHDTILQKETDKADAVSILGELEHVLEGKINYIFELDRVLNEKLSALRQELGAERADRAREVGDLVEKLDAANREIGATHTLAAGYARDLSQVRDQLQRTEQELAAARTTLDQVRRELDATRTTLRATEEARTESDRKIAALRASWSWKLTGPFRAVRRLFS